jgi:hypothetical protein
MTRKIMSNSDQRRIAQATSDAYSFNRYKSWEACVAVLALLHFGPKSMEAILRSTHMRHAADASGKPDGQANSSDLKRYIEKNPKFFTPMDLVELINQTEF